VLPYYQFPSIPYALHLGNLYADRYYSDDLTSIYPDSLFYNTGQATIEDFINVRSESAEISSRPICPLGSIPLDNRLELLAQVLIGGSSSSQDPVLIAAENMFLYQITSRPQR